MLSADRSKWENSKLITVFRFCSEDHGLTNFTKITYFSFFVFFLRWGPPFHMFDYSLWWACCVSVAHTIYSHFLSKDNEDVKLVSATVKFFIVYFYPNNTKLLMTEKYPVCFGLVRGPYLIKRSVTQNFKIWHLSNSRWSTVGLHCSTHWFVL